MKDFTVPLRAALSRPCRFDFLGRFGSSRPAGSRVCWDRLSNLVNILRAGEAMNCSNLARAAGCCPKTIQRDIAFLRGRGLRISFNFSTGTYRLDDRQLVPWLGELLEKEAGR